MDYRIEFLRRQPETTQPKIVQTIVVSASHLREAVVRALALFDSVPYLRRAEYFRVWETEHSAEARSVAALAHAAGSDPSELDELVLNPC